MFFIPGFDIKGLSDDELYQKQSQIAARLAWASVNSSAMEMIAQLQNMSLAITSELQERERIVAFNMRSAMFPEIIETEPDLKPEKPAPASKTSRVPTRIMKKRTPGHVGGISASRSASPQYDEPESSDKDTDKPE